MMMVSLWRVSNDPGMPPYSSCSVLIVLAAPHITLREILWTLHSFFKQSRLPFVFIKVSVFRRILIPPHHHGAANGRIQYPKDA